MRQCKQAKYGERYGAAAGSFTACRCDCGHVSHACLHAHARARSRITVQHCSRVQTSSRQTSVCSLCFCCCRQCHVWSQSLCKNILTHFVQTYKKIYFRPYFQMSNTLLLYTKQPKRFIFFSLKRAVCPFW